jgi:hypothetical protein
MRASIIALIFLVASPLIVFAAPSSQIGSLVVRDTPIDDKPSNNLNDFDPYDIYERIIYGSIKDAYDIVEKLSDKKLEELVNFISNYELTLLDAKVGDNSRLGDAIKKIEN